MAKFLNGATGTTTGSTFTLNKLADKFSSQIDGTFGGATASLEGSLDGGSTFTTIFSVTAADFRVLDFTPAIYRYSTSGGDTTTVLNAWVEINREG